MYINSEIIRYAASILVSVLSFFVLRALRSMDECKMDIEKLKEDVREIQVRCNIYHGE